MTRLILVRHAQASFGADDYDQLSDLGKRQAEVTGRFLDAVDTTVVVTGTLKRHRQSAAGIIPNRRAIEDSGWNEFDYVDVIRALRPDIDSHAALVEALKAQPVPRKAFQSLYQNAVERWASGDHDSDYVEDRTAFCQRVFSALSRATAHGDTVVVVSSGGPIAAIVQRALTLQEPAARRVEEVLANASVTTLSILNESLRLITLNSYAHLEADDELITYR